MPISGYIGVIKQDGSESTLCDWSSRNCTIGRDPGCDISINLETVAPIHCSLELMDNGLVQATSHIPGEYVMLVNGVPMTGSFILPDNCLLTVGERHFRFFYPSSRNTLRVGIRPKDFTEVASPSVTSDPRKSVGRTNATGLLTPQNMPEVQPSRTKTTPRRLMSPARSPHPLRPATPKSALGTRERYGPVPPRPVATPPAVQVLRHTPKPVSPPRSATHVNKSPSIRGPGTPARILTDLSNPAVLTLTPKEVDSRHNMKSPRTPAVAKKDFSPGGLLSPLNQSELGQTNAQSALKAIGPRKLVIKSPVPRQTPRIGSTDRKQRPPTPYPSSAKVSPSPVSKNNTEKLGSPRRNAVGHVQRDGEIIKTLPAKTDRTPSDASKVRNLVGLVHPASAYIDRKAMKRPAPRRISMVTEDIQIASAKRLKGVSFGPALSPEQFDKALPPSTPVKKGAIPPVKVSTPRQTLRSASLVSNTPDPLSTATELSHTYHSFGSPSYQATTPGRVSAVVSIPPTPDENLLDSQSGIAETNLNSNPCYSAPVSRNLLQNKSRPVEHKRYSVGPSATSLNSRRPQTPQAPPSTPVSEGRRNRSQQTPQILGKSSEVSSTHKEHTQHTLENQTSQTKTKVGSNNAQATPSFSSPTMQPTSTPSSVITPLAARKSPKNNSKTAVSPRVSGVADMFASDVETGGVRSGRRSQSSPRRSVSGRRSVRTPSSVRKSVGKTPRLTGVRRLMKTPKTAVSPRVSDVGEMFVSDVETGGVRSGRRSQSSPRRSVSGRRSVRTPSSVRKSVGKTPRLTGVRRLMKTPKTAVSPRVSGVADMFASDVETGGVRSGRRSQSSPRRSVSGRRSVRTPSSVRKSVGKTPRLTGVRRLMKTPRTAVSPRVSDVGEMFVSDVETGGVRSGRRSQSSPRRSVSGRRSVRTPSSVRKSVGKTPRLTGVRRLMKTPKTAVSPRVSDVGEMFVSDVETGGVRSGRRSQSSPRRSVSGRRSVRTPSSVRKSVGKTPRLTGVRRLMKTPRTAVSPRVSDVGEMFVSDVETGGVRSGRRSQSSPRRSVSGRRSVRTPSSVRKSVGKTPRLTGVRRLMKTPRTAVSPRVSDVGEMFVSDVETGGVRSGRRSQSSPRRSVSGRRSVRTPSSVRKSVGKTPRLTGVRRLMKTPKTAVSPRVSGVADMFVSDVETGGVRSGRRSQSSPRRSVSGRRSVRTPSSVRKSVGKTPRLTGVRRLMKTPRTAVSPRVSDVGEMFVSDVETGGVRSGRRSQSSPRRSVSGRRSVRTPSSVRKSVGKTPRLTGVRRLMKTPKTAVSPRVSGVADMFASDVETGGVRSGRRSQSSPRRSVSGRRSVRTPSSVRKSVGKTPRLTGVRRLMKTPRTAVSPRVSGVADMFASDVETGGVRSGRRSQSSPRRSVSGRRSVRTPSSVRKSVGKTPRLTGVRRLMKTPKTAVSPRVSGVADMFASDVETGGVRSGRRSQSSPRRSVSGRRSVRTPSSVRKSVGKTPRLTGVRRLMKTPKTAVSPRVSGVADMFVSDVETGGVRSGRRSQSSPRRSVSGRRSVRTPSSVRKSVGKTPRLTGVRRLMKTPRTAVSPRVSDVGEMFVSDVETGGVRSGRRSQSSPRRSVSGRRSVRTPSSVRKSVGKTPRLTGVRRLMKTPKTAVSPRVSGVADMFASDVETGGVRSGRRSQSSPRRSVSGRRSVRTPSSVRKSVGKTPRLTGVRRLMKTPRTAVSPRVSGVADMFASDVETGGVRSGRRSQSSPRRSVSGRRSVRTPSSVRKSVGKTPRLTGVRRLMKTPKTAVSPRVSGVADMFASDVETGGVRSGRRSQSSPRRSVSGRRSVRTPSSVRKSVGKTPRLTGVRKLMKTPKTAVSPRVSGLAEMFADLSVGIGDMVSQSGDVAENVRSSAVLKKVRSRKAGGLGRRERLARNVRDISPSDKSVVGGADSPKPVGLVSNALRGRKRVLAAKAESVERSTAGKRKKNFEVSREKQASRSPSTDLNGSRGTNAGGLHTLVPAGSGRKNPGKKDSVSESLPVSKPSVASRRLRGRNAVTRSETPTAGSIAVRMRGRRAANKLENNTITASSPLASLSAISPKKTLGSRAAAVKRARRAPVSPPGSSKSIFSRPESLTRKGKRSRTVTKIAKSESASSPRQPESHSPDLARVPQKRLRSKVIALSTTGTSASPSDSHKSRSPESKRLRSRDGAKVVSAASPSSGPRKSLSSEPSGVAPRKLRSRATVRKTRNVSTPASSPREPVTPEASAVSQKKSRSRTTTRNAVHTLSAPPNSEKSSPVKLEKEVKRKTPPVRSVRPGALPSKETADLTSNAISQSLRNKAARRKATPKRSSNGFKSANPTPSKQARSHRVTAGKVKARGKTGRALLSKTTNTPVTEPNHGTRAKQSTQQSPKPLSIPAVSPRRTRARTAKRP